MTTPEVMYYMESKYLLLLNNLLSEYKDKFNKCNYSLIYKVDKNYRVSTMITDKKEKRLYCGLSCISHIDMQEFLERKLKNIKKTLDLL